jgi:hypothetical protein
MAAAGGDCSWHFTAALLCCASTSAASINLKIKQSHLRSDNDICFLHLFISNC